MNTNGGGLCYTHTGQYGMFAVLESVRQLRGTAFRQVKAVSTSLATAEYINWYNSWGWPLLCSLLTYLATRQPSGHGKGLHLTPAAGQARSRKAPRPAREDRNYRCWLPGRWDACGASETGSGRRPAEVMTP
jgi:hypothetical protein